MEAGFDFGGEDTCIGARRPQSARDLRLELMSDRSMRAIRIRWETSADHAENQRLDERPIGELNVPFGIRRDTKLDDKAIVTSWTIIVDNDTIAVDVNSRRHRFRVKLAGNLGEHKSSSGNGSLTTDKRRASFRHRHQVDNMRSLPSCNATVGCACTINWAEPDLLN